MVGVYVSRMEGVRFEVVCDFNSGKISRKLASEILQISERTVSRIASKIKLDGIVGIKHRNLGRTTKIAHPAEYKAKIIEILKTDLYDFNISHALEVLKDSYGFKISYSTLRRWCLELALIKHIKVQRRVVRKARQRVPREGFILQMDGSHHKFNGKDEWCLIAAIDDATSEIPYAEFFKGETTLGCMKVLKKIIEKKGVPRAIYTDRAGWSGGGKRVNFNQFARACEKLGIQIIFANSPEAKGRIERAFRTIQDRIIPELRRFKITSMKESNMYLQEKFLKNYWNEKNKVEPRLPDSAYRIPPPGIDLNEVFCVEIYRKINKDQTISWRNQRLVIQNDLKFNVRGYHAIIRRYIDGSSKAFVMGREITFKMIEKTPVKRDKPIERNYDFSTMWKLTNSMVAEIYNSQLEGRNPDWERFKKKSA